MKLIFPPTGKLKKQVLEILDELGDTDSKKSMKRVNPYMKVEKLIKVYNKLGLLKNYSGIYLVEAEVDKGNENVNNKRRLFKVGKDRTLPSRLLSYLSYYGTYQIDKKGNKTHNGVKIFMLITLKKDKKEGDYIYNPKLEGIEKDVLNQLRQLHNTLQYKNSLKFRGKERFIIKTQTIRTLINSLKSKMNNNHIINKSDILDGLKKSTDKKHVIIQKGFLYRLIENKGTFSEHKKGTIWQLADIKKKEDQPYYMKKMKSKTKKTKKVISVTFENMSIFENY